MPTYSYNSSVPAADHDPSVDQPTMQTNALSIQSIWSEDHYTFGSDGSVDGQHKIIRFPSNVLPSAPSGLGLVGYTQPGTADNTRSQFFVQNSSNSILMTGIRAFAYCTIAGSSLTQQNGTNITMTRLGLGNYKGTFVSNIVSGSNYVVLATCRNGSSDRAIWINVASQSASDFTLLCTWIVPPGFSTIQAVDPSSISIAVLQI